MKTFKEFLVEGFGIKSIRIPYINKKITMKKTKAGYNVEDNFRNANRESVRVRLFKTLKGWQITYSSGSEKDWPGYFSTEEDAISIGLTSLFKNKKLSYAS